MKKVSLSWLRWRKSLVLRVSCHVSLRELWAGCGERNHPQRIKGFSRYVPTMAAGECFGEIAPAALRLYPVSHLIFEVSAESTNCGDPVALCRAMFTKVK